jgi:KaiC/GvpD/RAD55 family RecA-like ATPase
MMDGYVHTYVKGLDERIEGGIPKGHIVLICGPAGSMKSSFTFNIMYNYVREKRGKALYLTLEQSRESLVRQMKKLGLDPDKFKDEIAILDIAWLRKELEESGETSINWFDSVQKQLVNYREFIEYDILGFDSLDALYTLSTMENPRSALFFFFEKLRSMKVTSLIISEMSPERLHFGKYGVEPFLADGIIHLDLERIGKTVGRFISIVKMREVKHPTDYFPLLVDGEGFKIVTR